MPQLEVVLNKPLSGTEVKRIILSRLETAMAGDTRLADYIAFPSFGFQLDLAISLTGAVEPHDKINYSVAGNGGDPNAEGEPHTVIVHAGDTPKPPNQARIEAGLGVPVLTRDEKGREIEKEVKYGQPVERRG